MKKTVVFTLLAFGVIGLNYLNCSPAQFIAETTTKANGVPNGGGEENNPNDPGISGGHFDLDTSHMVYAANKGTTDHHVHEYDDEYKTTQIDFFNLLDPKFTKLSDVINSSQNFVITIANAELSPGAMIEINGVLISAGDLKKKVDAFLAGQPLTQYSIGGANPLTSLKIKFSRDVLSQSGLVPTQTGCVRSNDLGANGQYRNGALTIQIHDAARFKLDAKTLAATPDGGLLWEATVFWHKDGSPCL